VEALDQCFAKSLDLGNHRRSSLQE
jgi:hypothetical protein